MRCNMALWCKGLPWRGARGRRARREAAAASRCSSPGHGSMLQLHGCPCRAVAAVNPNRLLRYLSFTSVNSTCLSTCTPRVGREAHGDLRHASARHAPRAAAARAAPPARPPHQVHRACPYLGVVLHERQLEGRVAWVLLRDVERAGARLAEQFDEHAANLLLGAHCALLRPRSSPGQVCCRRCQSTRCRDQKQVQRFVWPGQPARPGPGAPARQLLSRASFAGTARHRDHKR